MIPMQTYQRKFNLLMWQQVGLQIGLLEEHLRNRDLYSQAKLGEWTSFDKLDTQLVNTLQGNKTGSLGL